jgi:hypothetical protein
MLPTYDNDDLRRKQQEAQNAQKEGAGAGQAQARALPARAPDATQAAAGAEDLPLCAAASQA